MTEKKGGPDAARLSLLLIQLGHDLHMKIMKVLTRVSFALALALALIAAASPPARVSSNPTPADLSFPHYDHVIVIVEENEGYGAIINNPSAPTISALARDYGNATAFYAETHPSEPNYVAMIGGDTYGIQDDDAYYCKPASTDGDPHCPHAGKPGYVDHSIAGPSLPSQLEAAGLAWRGYFGAFDPAHPMAVFNAAGGGKPAGLYASKHNPFLNFVQLRNERSFAKHLASLDRFKDDLAGASLPNFSFVIPDQCDDMHGIDAGPNVPQDCESANRQARIARGDAFVKQLMNEIQSSPTWKSATNNVAVVITFDENDDEARASGAQGCCGSDPAKKANGGGGLIPTIVITNHGPRGVIDATPYNHYSLLRTIEDAFGIHQYLGAAGDWQAGVRPMTPLFAVRRSGRALGLSGRQAATRLR